MKRPYFFLPFDHRSTFAKKLMGYEYPTTKEEAKEVSKMKEVVFDALLEAREMEPEFSSHTALLVDLEFGSDIVSRARTLHIPFAISTEKSGQDLYTFEYGDRFGEILLNELPTYAKALVRYNPAMKEENQAQLHRLKQLSELCEKNQIGFMFELLVQGEGLQRELMIESMKEILAFGIKPTLWKLEGLNTPESWQIFKKLTDIDIIVLGRGDERKTVEQWVRAAASSGVCDGFAIGRTIFFTPLERLRDGHIDREEAVQLIAKNYVYFMRLWKEHAKT